MTIGKYKCYFTSDCFDFVEKFPPQNCCVVEDKTIDLNSSVDVKHLDELEQKFIEKHKRSTVVNWSANEIKGKFMEMAKIKTIQKSYNNCRELVEQSTGSNGANEQKKICYKYRYKRSCI